MAGRGTLYQFRRWCYYKSFFPKLGLRFDDVMDETPVVKEALKRLPKDQLFEREYRISRALQLDLNKAILPKNEWTEFDKDSRYLKPYLDDVVAELKEQSAWSQRNS